MANIRRFAHAIKGSFLKDALSFKFKKPIATPERAP